MALDFGYTCPDINSSIDDFKSRVSYHLDSLLDDCCPLFDGEKKDELIDNYVGYIYSEFESCFEDVRRTNENMRKEADYQIENVQELLDDAKADIHDLENRIDSMEKSIY